MHHARRRKHRVFVTGVIAATAAVAASTSVLATTVPDGEEPAGTEAPLPETVAGEAPTCTGEEDGVLTIGTVLPETGNLAFLGPPEFAAADLAVKEINENGGVLGTDVVLLHGDSGDAQTDIANQTVDRHLAAGVDAFIGAASSGVSQKFINKLVANCRIQFSPANTAPDFTTWPDDNLYFRTAPSDVLQGRVLADVMIEDGITDATFLAIQDPYGDGLLSYSSEAFAEQGGTIVDSFSYDQAAANFSAEAERVVSGDPAALVLIGFEESAQILAALFESGFTPDVKAIYLVDGNVGNALGAQLPAGTMVGIKGTIPQAEMTEEFRTRLLEVDPELQDFTYAPETYDAVMITALAALVAGSDNPALVAAQINGVTRDGEKCTTFAECKALIEAGTDIDYDGPAGPMTFGPAGEPSEASFAILSYDANNVVGGDIATVFAFATI